MVPPLRSPLHDGARQCGGARRRGGGSRRCGRSAGSRPRRPDCRAGGSDVAGAAAGLAECRRRLRGRRACLLDGADDRHDGRGVASSPGRDCVGVLGESVANRPGARPAACAALDPDAVAGRPVRREWLAPGRNGDARRADRPWRVQYRAVDEYLLEHCAAGGDRLRAGVRAAPDQPAAHPCRVRHDAHRDDPFRRRAHGLPSHRPRDVRRRRVEDADPRDRARDDDRCRVLRDLHAACLAGRLGRVARASPARRRVRAQGVQRHSAGGRLLVRHRDDGADRHAAHGPIRPCRHRDRRRRVGGVSRRRRDRAARLAASCASRNGERTAAFAAAARIRPPVQDGAAVRLTSPSSGAFVVPCS